jgi:hypothetical protein
MTRAYFIYDPALYVFINWHAGFWDQTQPDPRSGECVDVTLMDNQQSWELTTCESLLPFLCRTAACPAGKPYDLSADDK